MCNLDISFLLGKKVSFMHRQCISAFPFAPEKNEYAPAKEIRGIVVGGYLEVLNKDNANTIQLLISCENCIFTRSPDSIKMIAE